MSISSLLSSLEVSSNCISSSSLLLLLPPSSMVLGDPVVCTCSFFFLNTSLLSYSMRTTNLFGLSLIICTLIPRIIHKHQNTISKFFLHQNVIHQHNTGIFFAFYMIQSLDLKFYNVISSYMSCNGKMPSLSCELHELVSL